MNLRNLRQIYSGICLTKPVDLLTFSPQIFPQDVSVFFSTLKTCLWKRKKTEDAWPGGLPVAVRHDPAVGVEGAVGRPASGCSSLHHIRRVAAAAVYINNRVINQYILKLTIRIKLNKKGKKISRRGKRGRGKYETRSICDGLSVTDPGYFGTDRMVPLANGSGSRSCYFHQWPSRRQSEFFFFWAFFLITFWRYNYIIFRRKKVIKKSQNSRNQGFSYCFCFMKEPSNRVTSSSCYNFVRVLQNFWTGLLLLFVKILHFKKKQGPLQICFWFIKY